MTIPVKAVVVLSGGLDSSTLLHDVSSHLNQPGDELHAISFDYGQRHSKELEFAKFQAELLGATHKIVDMTFMADLFSASGSSLITQTDVPEGHYGEESMKATIVPNRNMIMMSIAAGYMVSIGGSKLASGVHAGDHFIYPDCRPHFFNALAQAIYFGNEGSFPEGEDGVPTFEVYLPFINSSKNDIAARAFELNVPIDKTWSCYKGGELHCGKCGTCVERLEAIASTGNEDPTEYEDPTFYLEALKRETV